MIAVTTPHRGPAGDDNGQRKAVTGMFRSSVPAWEDIYHRTDHYSVIYQRRRAVALSLIRQLDLPRGSQIVDLGCGPGVTAVTLATRGYSVHAVDIVPEMLQTARLHAEARRVSERIRVIAADGNMLPFRNCAFDAVVAIGVVEWTASPRRLLLELSRVLKGGGYLIISSDNARALHILLNPARWKFLAPLRRLIAGKSEKHPKTYAYSVAEFRSLLSETGLVPIETRQVGFGPLCFLGLRVPDALGLRVDRILQSRADSGAAPLQSAGHVYVVAAMRPKLPLETE